MTKYKENIMEIVHEYEDRLCKNTENGIYNKFSGGLSEKFQGLVRAHFPLIDHVGLIIEKSEMNDSTEHFSPFSSEGLTAVPIFFENFPTIFLRPSRSWTTLSPP